ncbi:hypothetical protein B0T16DRAFT_237910 [Cercophora newfieldiana]|uniref:Uncharacterized protein n=1 Tax=Cercophora newfieldiana TaxID=92897 RepID=A0AA40CHM5_9PEZI|nr:hypothetical protein B0T16DRAFT_237910 [Cercophora newfieldiana]
MLSRLHRACHPIYHSFYAGVAPPTPASKVEGGHPRTTVRTSLALDVAADAGIRRFYQHIPRDTWLYAVPEHFHHPSSIPPFLPRAPGSVRRRASGGLPGRATQPTRLDMLRAELLLCRAKGSR